MSHHISQRKRHLWRMFTLVTVAILAVPYTAIGAGPALNTRTLGVSSSRYEQTHAQRFDRPRFFGRHTFAEAEVTVEQSQSAPIMEPEKPNQKRTYVQPHWVDGGYGVEILEPGHWIDAWPGRCPVGLNSMRVEGGVTNVTGLHCYRSSQDVKARKILTMKILGPNWRFGRRDFGLC
jgi:hypothetical protein